MAKKLQGKLNGPSHRRGGIKIEAEGGEIIINKNKNNAAGIHEEGLLALNENPNDYEIVKKNSKFNKQSGHKYPVYDSKRRRT